MRIAFNGRLDESREIRLGHVGCGGHSFRNLFPLYPFLRTDLVAVCDLDGDKAATYAAKAGARSSHTSAARMIREENLDAVVICLGYDRNGRVLHPRVAIEAMEAGAHVFIEKPPATTVAEVDEMQAVSDRTGKQVQCGLKHTFMPTVVKAKALIDSEDFGTPQLLSVNYPEFIPTPEEFARFFDQNERVDRVVHFIDHLCHPYSKVLYLFGTPQRMIYHRTANDSGVVNFLYDSGKVATMSLPRGGSGGTSVTNRLEVSGDRGRTVIIEGTRLHYLRGPGADPESPRNYGQFSNYYSGTPDETSAFWSPEVNLGQLYANGGVVLGYYDELRAFTDFVLGEGEITRGSLEHCRQICRAGEKFREGAGRMIELNP